MVNLLLARKLKTSSPGWPPQAARHTAGRGLSGLVSCPQASWGGSQAGGHRDYFSANALGRLLVFSVSSTTNASQTRGRKQLVLITELRVAVPPRTSLWQSPKSQYLRGETSDRETDEAMAHTPSHIFSQPHSKQNSVKQLPRTAKWLKIKKANFTFASR